MPNGGVTPDCLHCKNYVGRFRETPEPYCEYHRIKIINPVHVFCSKYIDFSPEEDVDWLDRELGNREGLDDSLMYAWLGGYETPFFHVPFAPIAEYTQWTWEQWRDELGKLADKYRDRLKKK